MKRRGVSSVALALCLVSTAACDPGDRTIRYDGPAFTLDTDTPSQEFVVSQCGPVYNRSPTSTVATLFADSPSDFDLLRVKVSDTVVDVALEPESATFSLPSLRGDGSSCSLTTIEFSTEVDEPIEFAWYVELRESGPNPVNPRHISVEVSGGPPP